MAIKLTAVDYDPFQEHVKGYTLIPVEKQPEFEDSFNNEAGKSSKKRLSGAGGSFGNQAITTISQAPPPKLNILERALDSINHIGNAFGLKHPIFPIAKKTGISKEAKTRATIKLMAKEEGVPVSEFRESPGMIEQGAQGFVGGFTGGLGPAVREATTGETPWEPETIGEQITRQLGSLGGMITGAPAAIGQKIATPVFATAPKLVPVAAEKMAPRLAKSMVSEVIKLAPMFGASELGTALKKKTLGEAANTIWDATKSGAFTGAVFGASKGLFPKQIRQRAARIITGLVLLNAQRAIEDPQHRLPWNKPLAEVVKDTAMDVYFLWHGLGDNGLIEAEKAITDKINSEGPRSGGQLLESTPPTVPPTGPASSKIVEATPTLRVEPTAFGKLKNQLYGKQGRFISTEGEAKGAPEKVSPQPSQDVTRKDGKPFKTAGVLKAQLRAKGLQDSHEPVQVEGGWVGRLKGETNAVSQQEAGKVDENVTQPEISPVGEKVKETMPPSEGGAGVRPGGLESILSEINNANSKKELFDISAKADSLALTPEQQDTLRKAKISALDRLNPKGIGSVGEKGKEAVRAEQAAQEVNKAIPEAKVRFDGYSKGATTGGDYSFSIDGLNGTSISVNNPKELMGEVKRKLKESGIELSGKTGELKEPWKNAKPEDESRWYGSKVTITPTAIEIKDAQKKGEMVPEPRKATVSRVLNNGRLLEVYFGKDPMETMRIPSDMVSSIESIQETVAKKPVKAEPSKPKKKFTTTKPDPFEFAEEMKAAGVGRRESWSRWVQKTRLKPEMDAKDWYEIYDRATAIPKSKAKISKKTGELKAKPTVKKSLKVEEPKQTKAEMKAAIDKFFAGDKTPRYSTTETRPEKGMSKGAVRLLAGRISSKWKNAPEIIIHQFQKDLPGNLNDPSKIIKGAFIAKPDGTREVHIVAENLSNAKDLYKTIAEEVLGHAGLREAFKGLKDNHGNDLFESVLIDVWRKYGNKIQEIAEDPAYNINTKTHKGRLHATDEWVSKQIANDSLPKTIWNRIVMLFKSFARKMGFQGNYSLAEIKGVIRNAITKGGVKKSFTTRINEFAVEPRYSLKKAVKKITDNPNFKRWFGKSVVTVDGKPGNEPLVVYHGTPTGGFTTFKKTGLRDYGYYGTGGFYFTTDKKLAEMFTSARMKDRQRGKKQVYEVYLSIKHPLVIREITFDNAIRMVNKSRELKSLEPLNETRIKSLKKLWDQNIKKFKDGIILSEDAAKRDALSVMGDIISLARAGGYDGIIGESERTIIAFNPTQIKSIYNRGTFSPENPDIRYSLATEKDKLKAAREAIKRGLKEAPKEKVPLGLKPFMKGMSEKIKSSEFVKFLDTVKTDVQKIFVPETIAKKVSPYVDPLLAHKIQQETYLRENYWKVTEEKRKWWDTLPEEAHLAYMDAVEGGNKKALLELAGGDLQAYAVLVDMAKHHRQVLDAMFKAEKDAGIPINYIKDYWPHVWEDLEKAAIVFNKYAKSLGKDRFAKLRTIDKIKAGLELGLKLKTTNPEKMIAMRLDAGHRAIIRQEFINELQEKGLAERFTQGTARTEKFNTVITAPNGKQYLTDRTTAEKFKGISKAGQVVYFKNLTKLKRVKPYVKPTETAGMKAIDAPDGHKYMIPKELYPLIENAGMIQGKGQSLWVSDTAVGKMYRTVMHGKNLFIPIKLGLSLFHPVHVLTIDMAARRIPIYLDILNKQIGWSDGLKQLAKVSTGLTEVGSIKKGWDIIKAYGKDPSKLTDYQKESLQYLMEGGMSTRMSEEWRINAKEAFQKALNDKNFPGIVGHGMRHILEAMQKPIFEIYVPSLKVASYLDAVKRLIATRPELGNDIDKRRLELRKIAKEVDNRYGELAYKTLFWNRIVKDIGIGSTLSMGWQLGFIREYGGGAIDFAKFARDVFKKNTKPEITRKMLFTMDYTIQSMIIGGLVTWALTGTLPTKLLDYFYPRSGEKDLDGTDVRYNTPFYTREFFALREHIRKEGVIGGLTQTAKNKANPIISPFFKMLQNKNYYGTDIRDPHAPLLTQAKQLVEYFLGELLPISVTSMRKGMETMGFAKALISSELGFTKAPRYVTETPIQKKIFDEYSRYEKAGRTKEQAERSRIKRQLRVEILKTGTLKPEHLDDAIKKGVFGIGSRGRIRGSIKRFLRTAKLTSDVRVFSALPRGTQLYLLEKMNPKDLKKYFKYAKRSTKIQFLRRKRHG